MPTAGRLLRNSFLMLVSRNEIPAWRRQGCLRWKITPGFDERIAMA